MKYNFSDNDLFILDTLLGAHVAEAEWAGTTADTSNLVAEGLVEMDVSAIFCRLTPLGVQVAKDVQKRPHPKTH